jgi:beta-lactamase regulating signal transducer with metallopeptidase domain
VQNLTDAFLQTLNMSFTAGIVILCVCLARLLLRRAPAVLRYALWAVVLFRLLCPVSLESALALLPTDPAPVRTDLLYAAQPQVHTGVPALDAAVGGALPAADPTASANPLQIYSAVGAVLWVTGCAGMLLAGGISLFRLRRRLRGAREVEPGIYVAAGLPTAFVLGVLRPRIYLPKGLTDGERDLVLAHERAHIRRGDPALRLLAWVALCLHWFHPLVWLAFCLSGRDMEAACDESVLRKLGPQVKRNYSAALLRVATGRRIALTAPLAFGEGGVKGRIRGVLRWKRPALWAMAAMVALVLALGIGLALNRPEQTAYLRMGGNLYRSEETTVSELPAGSEEIGRIASVLHNTQELPEQEGQATNLDEMYAGCAVYASGDRAYVENYGGFYLCFVQVDDEDRAAETAWNLEDVEVLLLREEETGSLAVFRDGDQVGACRLPDGDDADMEPAPGPGQTALLRLSDCDVLICGEEGLQRAEREDATARVSATCSASENGLSIFVLSGAADGTAVYRVYDEAGEREDLRMEVEAQDTLQALVETVRNIQAGSVVWETNALTAEEQAFLDRICREALAISAAWEGLPAEQIEQGDCIRLGLYDGGVAYVYLWNGETPVLQFDDTGWCTAFSAQSYALLDAWRDGEKNPVTWSAERLYFGQEAGAISILDEGAALAARLAQITMSEPGTAVNEQETAYRFTQTSFRGKQGEFYVYAEGNRAFVQRGETGRRSELDAATFAEVEALFPEAEAVVGDLDGDGRTDRVSWDLLSRDRGTMTVNAALGNGQLVRGILEGIAPGPILAADVTGDGRDEILALCDLGGAGGAGSWDLAVWTLQDGALSSLPLPAQNPEEPASGWNSGYAFAPQYVDGFRVRVTGERLDVTYEIPEEMRDACVGNGFDADGNARFTQSGAVDGVSAIEVVPGAGGAAEIRLWQYLWVYGHSDCVGYAVSTIAWDGEAFQLLEQEVLPAFPG